MTRGFLRLYTGVFPANGFVLKSSNEYQAMIQRKSVSAKRFAFAPPPFGGNIEKRNTRRKCLPGSFVLLCLAYRQISMSLASREFGYTTAMAIFDQEVTAVSS